MKPKDMNRSIAEHCGWQFLPERDTRLGPQPELWEGPDGDRYFQSPLKDWPPYPNYHEDLNAMHEAEKTLDDRSHYKFCHKHLPVVATRNSHIKTTRAITSATAAQRAEAFLRTVGKWKD